MRCFLLAAGMGTRLRPITDTTPKCLVPINGKPLLQYWFELLTKYSVEEVFINLHHLAEKVSEFVVTYRLPIVVSMVREHELLGSLGTLIYNLPAYQNEHSLLVCYADNLTNINLEKFMHFHKSHDKPITIGLFETPTPQECGILELDEQGTVVSFEEKPAEPKSNLANAGIYVIDVEALKAFANMKIPCDVAYDFLPLFIGKMKGYRVTEFLYDIGDLRKLTYAEDYVKINPHLF